MLYLPIISRNNNHYKLIARRLVTVLVVPEVFSESFSSLFFFICGCRDESGISGKLEVDHCLKFDDKMKNQNCPGMKTGKIAWDTKI